MNQRQPKFNLGVYKADYKCSLSRICTYQNEHKTDTYCDLCSQITSSRYTHIQPTRVCFLKYEKKLKK